MASVFDYLGPVKTLIKCLKYQKTSYLAEIFSSFMFLQWERLDWETPDLIIPIPRSWIRRFAYGYNQSALLAKHLSQNMKVPYFEPLRRKNFDVPQTLKNKTERTMLSSLQFILKHPEQLAGKTLLIVDDVMTTLATLESCAEVLKTANPKKIYALTLCRSLPAA